MAVVIPAFNRSQMIARALDSVFRQQRKPKEVIVVDAPPPMERPTWSAVGLPSAAFVVPAESSQSTAAPAPHAIEASHARRHGTSHSLIPTMNTCRVRWKRSMDVAAVPELVLSFGDATVVTGTFRKPHGLFAPHIDLARDAEPLTAAGSRFMGSATRRHATQCQHHPDVGDVLSTIERPCGRRHAGGILRLRRLVVLAEARVARTICVPARGFRAPLPP